MREGDQVRQGNRVRIVSPVPRCNIAAPVPAPFDARNGCIDELLDAIADLDRDDIHQAAERLARVQAWIIRETERAAADPVFDALRLAS
jgi:hypothetical protein